MPRGWFPRVRTSWILPETVRPVGWSALRTMLTRAPGRTWAVVGTRMVVFLLGVVVVVPGVNVEVSW